MKQSSTEVLLHSWVPTEDTPRCAPQVGTKLIQPDTYSICPG